MGSLVFDYTCSALAKALPLESAPPKLYGWGDGRSRTIDLSSMMDPGKLADSSANLNLSLMKWRMVPDLKLEAIAAQKVLIVGSGTLGCNVARHLLMWGVRSFTFIDRGTVSYSNPVRQSLFVHSDATEAKNKAQAAAEGLKKIHPTVDAKYVNMTIYMPGHPFDEGQREAIKASVEMLEELVKSHDSIFLLTDSRESRWLPTLLGAAHNKVVINAALGFDSWVVMRHGVPKSPGGSLKEGLSGMQRQRLGCYFCSDILAPRDSLSDRTLDQQCTVTRPAVSALASAYAVELLAGIINHPLGAAAPAALGGDADDEECSGKLGLLPQQIRGNVFTVEQTMMICVYFPKCIACCDTVVNRFKAEGFPFIAKALNEPSFLEDITGIKKDLEGVEQLGMEGCDWEEDE